jgi:putative membrane protein
MADDHTKALDELKQLAQAKGVTLPSEPSRQQKAMEKRLSSLSGDKFDKQYLEQVGDRSSKDTHKLLKRASDKAQDTDLKNYASKTLGVVESHQQLAEEAERNLRSSSRGKSGTGSSESGSSGGKTPSSSTGTE